MYLDVFRIHQPFWRSPRFCREKPGLVLVPKRLNKSVVVQLGKGRNDRQDACPTSKFARNLGLPDLNGRLDFDSQAVVYLVLDQVNQAQNVLAGSTGLNDE